MRQDVEKLGHIYAELGFKEGLRIAHAMLRGGRLNHYRRLYRLENKTINESTGKLSGGGKTKNTIISYNGHDYMFYRKQDDYSISYKLHQESNDNKPECILIEVSIEDRNAEIFELSYDPKCFPGLKADEHTGTTLLKLALKLLEKIKDKYKLRYVQLMDNSRKWCNEVENFITLADLSMFTSGNTWYGKHGFIPFNTNTEKTDKINLKLYKKHQHIVNNTLVKNTNIQKYINRIFKKHRINVNKNDIDKLIVKYNNIPIVHFFSRLLKKYNNNCTIFYYIYEKLKSDFNMYNLYRMVYWKKL